MSAWLLILYLQSGAIANVTVSSRCATEANEAVSVQRYAIARCVFVREERGA